MDIKQPDEVLETEESYKRMNELNALQAIKIDPEILKKQKKISSDINLDWYADEYLKIVNVPNTKIKGKYAMYRNDIIRNSKYAIHNDITNTIVVVFKLYDYVFKKEINYGMLFCKKYSDVTPIYKSRLVPDNIHGQFAFIHYSSTNSYISCDGEYRPMFSMYKAIAYTKKKFPELWDDLLVYIMAIKVRRSWSFLTSYFYPNKIDSTLREELENTVKHEGFANTLLTICWFNSINNVIIRIIPTHVNENFKSIFYSDYMEEDRTFFKSLLKKYTGDLMEEFRVSLHFSQISMVHAIPQYIQHGIKLMPLSINDARSPFKLTSKVWREYLISSRCNDLVINCICPNFPIMIDWFYIKNSRKNLYDNVTQYNRLKYSEITHDILSSLYDAQRNTYFITDSKRLKEISSGKQVRKFVNSKFKKLSDLLDNTIRYSTGELLMSNMSIAIISEYAGRTVADVIHIVGKSVILDAAIGHPLRNTGYDFFAKYMFEICYGLYCANSKFGVMHGDFHLNNATIGQIYSIKTDESDKISNPSVKYHIGDVDYSFPTNGYYAFVIDFSRGIIDPSRYDSMADPSLPSAFKLIRKEEDFIKGEITSLLQLYFILFPNKENMRDSLELLCHKNPGAMFKILTCMDIYMFSARLARLIEQVDYNADDKCKNLIDKLFKKAEYNITTKINSIIDDHNLLDKVLDEEYPLYEIIKACFTEYTTPRDNYVDCYNFNNTVKYSMSKESMFPDIWTQFKYKKYDDKNKEKSDFKIMPIKEIDEKRHELYTEKEKNIVRSLYEIQFLAEKY